MSKPTAVVHGLVLLALAWPVFPVYGQDSDERAPEAAETPPETAPATNPPEVNGQFPETEEFRQTGAFPEENADADADGVPDIDDNCPDTVREQLTPVGALPVKVDECGCPIDPCTCDTDGDGVMDCRDFCPGTEKGAMVKADGCPIPVAETLQHEIDVRFGFNSAEIQSTFESQLIRLRELLLEEPHLVVTFEGHADWKGPQTYNQPLSERRAEACRQFVLRETRINPERVRAVGYGELKPIADNGTEEGRARNRRVTVIISDVRNETTAPVEAPAP